MKKNNLKKHNRLKKFFAKGFLCAAVAAMLGTVALSLAGCGKTLQDRVADNLSEWTSVYFYGESGFGSGSGSGGTSGSTGSGTSSGNTSGTSGGGTSGGNTSRTNGSTGSGTSSGTNGGTSSGFYASISSGVREEDYKMDGRSGKKVDFALLCVRPAQENNATQKISGSLTIDGTALPVVLELNPFNGFYMLDLERRLSGQEQISFAYAGQTIALQCESNSFAVNDLDAIRIAAENLSDKILECRRGNNLGAECYLRVLDRRTNQLDSTFWCLTVVTEQNKTYSIVISAKDGSVLAKSTDKDQTDQAEQTEQAD